MRSMGGCNKDACMPSVAMTKGGTNKLEAKSGKTAMGKTMLGKGKTGSSGPRGSNPVR